MTDDVSKLPAWPEKPKAMTLTHSAAWGHYDALRVAYYRARMEALERELRYVRSHFGDLIAMAARIDALLAACERKEG